MTRLMISIMGPELVLCVSAEVIIFSSRCTTTGFTSPRNARARMRIARRPVSKKSTWGWVWNPMIASEGLTMRSVMWPCKSKLTTMGTSGPTTSRTALTRSPSWSSRLSVVIAPCSESITPSSLSLYSYS